VEITKKNIPKGAMRKRGGRKTESQKREKSNHNNPIAGNLAEAERK
jgi:hypothetical protein